MSDMDSILAEKDEETEALAVAEARVKELTKETRLKEGMHVKLEEKMAAAEARLTDHHTERKKQMNLHADTVDELSAKVSGYRVWVSQVLSDTRVKSTLPR